MYALLKIFKVNLWKETPFIFDKMDESNKTLFMEPPYLHSNKKYSKMLSFHYINTCENVLVSDCMPSESKFCDK